MGPLYNAEPTREPAPSPWAGFAPSSPLFLAATALFIGGYAVWRFDPTVGPGSFPLWDLLVVLGFVSAIGGVVSWFYAVGDGEPAVAERPTSVEVESRPVAPRLRARPPAPTVAPRAELGRPRPDVSGPRRASGPASGFSAALATTPPDAPPWEGDDDELDRAPVPLPTPPVEPIPRTEVEQMLRELDGIERDASRRRGGATPAGY